MKKISPIQEHSARTSVAFLFYLILSGILCIIVDSIMNKFILNWGTSDLTFGALFLFYFHIKLNVRVGWIENFIIGKKKYPQLSMWFAEVKI